MLSHLMTHGAFSVRACIVRGGGADLEAAARPGDAVFEGGAALAVQHLHHLLQLLPRRRVAQLQRDMLAIRGAMNTAYRICAARNA